MAAPPRRLSATEPQPPLTQPLCPEAEGNRLDLSSQTTSCIYIASPPKDGTCEVFLGDQRGHTRIPLGFADTNACGHTFWCACESFVVPQTAERLPQRHADPGSLTIAQEGGACSLVESNVPGVSQCGEMGSALEGLTGGVGLAK